MKLSTIKLVTIIADRKLKTILVQFFKEAGISGYTYHDSYGKSSHLLKDASSDEAENLQFNVLTTEFLANSLMKTIAEELFAKEQVVVFEQNAAVIRGEKFEKVVYGL